MKTPVALIATLALLAACEARIGKDDAAADTNSAADVSPEGKAKEGIGGAKEKVGEATGKQDMQASGTAEQTEGKAQGGLGKVKDAASDAADNIKDAFKG